MSNDVIEVFSTPTEVVEVLNTPTEVVEVLTAGPMGPQANINYIVVSSSQTITNRQLIAADTSGGSFTLTLPANPNAGDAVDIFDYANTFDTNPLTIGRNGQPIESLAENLTANVEGAYFTLIYTGATRGWQILPRYGVSGIEDVLSTQGDLLYRGASSETRLPIGTAGQVLKVNSGATAPEWGAVSIPSGSISVTGSDLTLSGTTGTAITNATLASSGVAAGTYTKVTVDTKGRVTTGATATPSDIGAVPTSRTISSGTGLTGGGDLTANRTLAVSYGSTSGTAAEGNDARLSDARTPLSHTHGNITNDGKVGSTSGLPVVTTTAGAVTTLALGTANQVLRVNSGATGVEFGAGFDAASPPAIGNTTPAAGNFTTFTLKDSTGGEVATFDAQNKLTTNRTYDLPDRSGVLALEYEVRSDFVSPYTYTGIAAAGTSESTASWKIRRSEFDAAGTHVATLTATSVSWNNRLTASYS